ncbi:hypothetical protein LJC56_10495 [Christensenellaceae bacterium OttesenSCG-928-K19]|nr:hypothetical protein [Christensenellaceae bacterium OttesenSCG-928-K19]
MKKKQIGVFDFIPTDCAYTAQVIREWYGVERAEVTEHTVMQDFVYAFKERRDSGDPYDMVFICADDMMGVETAHNIREMDGECPIFLVSSVDDFSIEAFRLHVLDYLTKPVSPERIGRAISRIKFI